MTWLLAPLAGCAVAVGILGYLGLHVLRRQVIFVDLALAQIAALGATYAFFLGFSPESAAASVFSLLFCFAGAALFAVTRAQEGRLPQEAIIGICYVVAAASAVLLVDLARDPHGAERIRFLLVGSIVWATWAEIGLAAAVCGAVGAFHWVFRERFAQASWDAGALKAAGASLVLWDLLFYATFGVAITAIVRLIGVLLVFSYLIIPGAVASLFFDTMKARLLATWGLGLAVSFAGLLFGYEHPPGPVIVACFGAVLAVALLARAALDADRPAVRGAQLAGGAALAVVVFAALPGLVGGGAAHHDDGTVHHDDGERHHGEHEAEAGHDAHAEPPPHDAGIHHHPELPPAAGEEAALASPDALTRQEAIDRLVADKSDASTAILVAHVPGETDDELVLRIATELQARGHDVGDAALRQLAVEAEIPFVRLQAQELLAQ